MRVSFYNSSCSEKQNMSRSTGRNNVRSARKESSRRCICNARALSSVEFYSLGRITEWRAQAALSIEEQERKNVSSGNDETFRPIDILSGVHFIRHTVQRAFRRAMYKIHISFGWNVVKKFMLSHSIPPAELLLLQPVFDLRRRWLCSEEYVRRVQNVQVFSLLAFSLVNLEDVGQLLVHGYRIGRAIRIRYRTVSFF